MIKAPEPVVLVTCGVDVQLRYLAVLIMGWTEEAEGWVLDWSMVEGDPREPATLMDFMGALAEIRLEHPSADVPIHAVGVDSGFATDHVYRAVLSAPKRPWRWAFATKGFGGRSGEPIVLPFHDMRDDRGHRGYRPLAINTDGGKAELMSMLQIKKPGPGYIHIPKRAGADFVKQLTSEEARTKFDADGVAVGAVWKKRSADIRNEALDCAVINLALWNYTTRSSWLQLLTARYGKEGGAERFRKMHPDATARSKEAS